MKDAKTITTLALLLALALSALGTTCGEHEPSADAVAVEKTQTPAEKSGEGAARNPRWATPVDKPGLPNLHKINDKMYRGAQPEAEGFLQLKKMGIKTIINLRSMHTDRDDIREAGLDRDDFNYVRIPLFAWNAKDEHVVKFLKVVSDPANHPVFFHCQHGADRTGTMAASYRVVVEGWTREDALKEMTDGGYNFHGVWVNLVEYMKNLPVEKIRKEAGLSEK